MMGMMSGPVESLERIRRGDGAQVHVQEVVGYYMDSPEYRAYIDRALSELAVLGFISPFSAAYFQCSIRAFPEVSMLSIFYSSELSRPPWTR